MIDFQRLDLSNRAQYAHYLDSCGKRGCEYSFVNLFLWGRQKAAFVGGRLALLSQFDRRSVYPFPVGSGELKPVLDAIIQDAKARGIPCCLTTMTREDCDEVERLYPGAFQFHSDRDSFDYIYDINDLADLKGRKFQKKRNHLHRFEEAHPNCQVLPLDASNRTETLHFLQNWFTARKIENPHSDFHLEELALRRAFAFQEQLGLEGLVLMDEGQILAFTMGSRLDTNLFDVHFEKAREDVDGAYAAINQAFARYLRDKYPQVRYLDREDDLGLEGLRQAKLSYCPAILLEKFWARLWEDEDENTLSQSE